MKALIFNSGVGKRMGELTKDTHKSLVWLNDEERILERQLRILTENGIRDFVITTGAYSKQLEKVCEELAEKYAEMADLKFQFVKNPKYRETNYIYSMYLAKDYLDDDFLFLHGDLVFDSGLVEEMLEDERMSLCLINKEKKLPEKDFKGRVDDDLLKEVSIAIFDQDCYAFQPLYKLAKADVMKWSDEVTKFVEAGETNVYAENALNKILDDMKIYAMSYAGHYIEEIDTPEDYERVKREIREFDEAKNL